MAASLVKPTIEKEESGVPKIPTAMLKVGLEKPEVNRKHQILKEVFERLGGRSRRELVATLHADG